MPKSMRHPVFSLLTRKALSACILLYAATTAHAGGAPSLPALEPAAIELDTSALPASERAALVPLIRAARQMDALYMRQVWPRTPELIAQRQAVQASRAQAELSALNFFKGPWDRAGIPFIAGVPAKRPIGDFYPHGATKSDIEGWLATLSDPERKRALDNFTSIEAGQNDRFSVVPYGIHYKNGLVEAAAALREAAALTREPTLAKFLTLRAHALLNDDYYASDIAFVGLKGPIDVVLGPYEVDDDGWFGVKTAYEASIALLNRPATQRIKQISLRLQELEDNLPLSLELRGRKLPAAAPSVVLDAIYHAGYTATIFAVSYGLPNDLRVVNAAGSRTGTYSNIIKLRYETTYKPIAESILTNTDREKLRFEDILDEVMFVHLVDSLGPEFVNGTKQPIADALREDGSVAAMIRSMLLSLWSHRYLIDHAYVNRHEATTLYSAFLIPALSRARGGLLSCTPCQGSTYVLNHLLEAGAISLGADGKVKIDPAAADADIVRAAQEFVSPMARGDATVIKSLLQRYAVVTPTIREMLARLGPKPPQLRAIYRTADQLAPPEVR